MKNGNIAGMLLENGLFIGFFKLLIDNEHSLYNKLDGVFYYMEFPIDDLILPYKFVKPPLDSHHFPDNSYIQRSLSTCIIPLFSYPKGMTNATYLHNIEVRAVWVQLPFSQLMFYMSDLSLVTICYFTPQMPSVYAD